MRILCAFKVPSQFKGGIPKFILNLYQENLETFKDKEITILSINDKSEKKITLNKYNRNLKEIIYPPLIKFKTISISIGFFFYILLNSHKFKYIHYQHPDPFTALAIIFCKIYSWKTKIIITWHADIYNTHFLFSPFLISIDFILFAFAHKIVYLTSSHLKSSVLGNIPFFLKKREIIPNGIKLPNKKLIKGKTSLRNSEIITFVSVGRLVKYKGINYAIKALDLLFKNNNEIKFRYIIIGSGPEENKLKNLVKDLGLKKFIEFKGEISEKRKEIYLSKSDIYLFPSINQSEAYGLSQLEAISMGIPVINTYLKNGVNYLVPNNICGITVKKERSDLIFESILKLYVDDLLFRNLSKNGIIRAKEFSIKKTRIEYSKLFR